MRPLSSTVRCGVTMLYTMNPFDYHAAALQHLKRLWQLATDLVEQRQPIPGCLAFIRQYLRKERLIHRRLVLPAQIECAFIHVPLHGVAEQMGQQEEPLLRRDGVIHVNFRAVQIARERIRNVARNDRNAPVVLQVLLHPSRVVLKGNRHGEIVLAESKLDVRKKRTKERETISSAALAHMRWQSQCFLCCSRGSSLLVWGQGMAPYRLAR